MSVQLPEKPWTKGDSFKVEETGLTYVWSGEAWLSDGAELDVTEFDDRYVQQSGSWDMKLGTSLSVNVLKNVDGGTPFVYYEGDPEGTHPCGIVNRYMLKDYVDKKIAELPDDLATESYVSNYVTEEVFENATKTVHLRQPSDAVKINCSDPSSYSPQDSEKDILQGNYKTNGGSRSTWSFGFNKLREYWLYCWDMGDSNCGMTWLIKGNKKFTIDTNGAKMASAFIMKPHDMSGVDEGDYEKASMAAVEIDIGHRLRELKSILD